MIIENYINEVPNVDNYIEYFEKYRIFLKKKYFQKSNKRYINNLIIMAVPKRKTTKSRAERGDSPRLKIKKYNRR